MADRVVPVVLPHMGVSVDEATVVAWLKAVGDGVSEGEALCQISTDKVETDIPAPADGVLARTVAAVGETVPVGALLGELRVGADAPASVPALSVPSRFDPAHAARAALDHAGANGRTVSSPVARRLAADHGVDLNGLVGTGLRGRIRKADVLAAIDGAPDVTLAPPASAAAAGSAPAAVAPSPGDGRLPRGYEDVPHQVVPTTHARRVIAEHMIRSRQTAAHMTTEAEIDMSAALRTREALNSARLAAGQPKLTPLALIARACCTALAEFPDLNATFETERLIQWGEINVGIAVDTPQGLLVPVIRGCQRLTAPAIADAIADLADRARRRALTPDDMRAGTFTISNPGSVGAHSAMAIINQPQVAILGIPAIVRRPAVVIDEHGQETIGIRPLMMLALTFDHRAVDGVYATRCVVAIKRLLESWDAGAYG
ncbi:MAG TPA: 2-oxo acid dehydrogenase subunit E2 [Solirubrobacteraceae bacterium]|nr:2-oxo acid dehydrogenase subunit E2 [Solirubrobacteraceae bacterium]